jgi:hypothetical protein
MNRLQSFSPIVSDRSKLLILGSGRGLFTVAAEDAKPLVAHGWQRVEGRQA